MLLPVKSGLSALLVFVMVLAAWPVSVAKVHAQNATYYVDSVGGNDGNNGLSQSSAWKTLANVNAAVFGPGDRILFKAGGVWNGELWPKGSGASGNPIIIDMYGTGSKPAFVGSQTSNQTLKLSNQEYWEINNLDISANYSDSFTRRGIYVHAKDFGTIDHLYFYNLVIHDIWPNIPHTNNNTAKDTGGMFFQIEGGTTVTNFNDIRIENNTIRDLDREAITLTWTSWSNRTGETGGLGPWTGSTNVVIRNNFMSNIGGDGIVAQGLQSPLIEYNTIDGFGSRNYNVSYNAGMWAYSTDDAVFQYNEAYNGKTTKDGMAWDADARTNRTLFQYNYSHDNEGGAMLFISYGTEYSRDAVYRYNISQNDRNYLITATNPINASLYNNVFYVKSDITARMFNTNSGTASFKNNIFYYMGNTTANSWGVSYTYSNNTFFGNFSSTPNDPNKLTTDPKFVNPGTGGIGRSTLAGYQLQSDSPSVNSGIAVGGNGGRDFWGNPLYAGSPDRGMHEHPAGTAMPTNVAAGKPATSSSFINNPERVTDGVTSPASSYAGLDQGLQWTKIDLGAVYNVSEVKLWRYYDGGRTYKDVIVQLSNDPNFASGVTTVFNNDGNNSAGFGVGTNAEYAETASGKSIAFAPALARYVRIWSNGSSVNVWNHLVEAQVMGTP
ncbi:right-handed parallel beta-helix repeat-containing protein [Paenibacillus sp. LHD-117]|uniref:right-handed parallel beta-helix repeat-containing protein n=1 Tax=Paenibacillus sp. LHD-117 TaxID=3071412 RepID=UPI0027E07356|nr:right-handed parallel beta-helix repeat-containing protein [Paenibacillus sp. LHD-117]MDQ6422146.1 right-handed parallel beta-helix repeat-containing protein [Paenibacillus sp. LHD-117]